MKNLILFVLALGLASCATIMNGSNTNVEITSVPPGAHFTSDRLGVEGITPASITIDNDRKAIHYTFTMDGYATTLLTDKARVSNWIIGNALFGGIIGFLIDVVNPAATIHHDVEAAMVPVGGVPVEDIQLAAKPESNWSRRLDKN